MDFEYSPYVNLIQSSGRTIYNPSDINDVGYWMPAPILERLLNDKLVGISLAGLPLRTRSKVIKSAVCEAMGYPIPTSFKKTQPRFPSQDLDTYVQKSNNLQIWNEEITPSRRYSIIRVNEEDVVCQVKIVTGEELALLDTTGSLTQKYQARLTVKNAATELVSEDTDLMKNILTVKAQANLELFKPTDLPDTSSLYSISTIFEKLTTLVGARFNDAGADQERNRGAILHSLICKTLGYNTYLDSGKFPDLLNQLLEVKLQMSPTIDLGLVSPDSELPLDIPPIAEYKVRHCDTRYAIFYANVNNGEIVITHFFLTSGEAFYSRFPQFQGKIVNRKLQIPLPSGFFAD